MPRYREERTPEPRMPNPILPYEEDEHGYSLNCQICGEDADGEMGEFGLPEPAPDGSVTIVAHGQCGLDHGLLPG